MSEIKSIPVKIIIEDVTGENLSLIHIYIRFLYIIKVSTNGYFVFYGKHLQVFRLSFLKMIFDPM